MKSLPFLGLALAAALAGPALRGPALRAGLALPSAPPARPARAAAPAEKPAQAAPAAKPDPAAPADQPPLAVPAGRTTDAQTAALARSAMASTDPGYQAQVLKSLQDHHFKSSLAPERELALSVQGMLEDRLGFPARSAVTYHKLEQSWPQSPYLAEGQVVMAGAALERKRYLEAEQRLHRALGADIPAEAQRRAQELLLWCLAEQGRAAEGGAIVQGLKPLGTARPSEKGLVGIMEAQCAAQQKADAEATLKDYRQLFPDGPRILRMELDWAKLQGATGDAVGAAQGFHKLILAAPAAPEADEARLALATLLTDGKLQPREAAGLPSPKSLLAQLQQATLKDEPGRQVILVKLRIALQEHRWQDAIDLAGQYAARRPSAPEALLVGQLRVQALRDWTQNQLDQHQVAPLLPYLDAEGIRCLTPALRLGLATRLAQGGLPEAARAIVRLAPPAEQPALLKAALDGTVSAANPTGALGLLPGKGETPQESLMRAQASLTLHDWAGARAALARASAGPERIQAVLAYLDRPPGAKEDPAARRREVEAWLARAPEKGADREPLAILAADLRVGGGDWRGALALYPSAPRPANRGWVALMRATCQARLGQPGPALATLKQAGDDPAFKTERQALQARLGGP